MDCKVTNIPYKQTGYCPPLAGNYMSGNNNLKPFYKFTPDENGINEAIAQRAKFPIDRAALVSILQQQYDGLKIADSLKENIDALANNNTYTICTAHQPNLMTGYLYFIYKIVHAIKLADELNQKHPDKRFVPVYFMGSEDNDLDELGKFKYEGKQYIWDAEGQTGAVGRMSTTSLKPLINELFTKLGPPNEHTERLKEIITEAYLEQKDITAATRYLVNTLFGEYGLIVFDPDDAAVKQQMVDIFEDDLFHHTANKLVSTQAEKLAENYKAQAYPRAINLFYLKADIRERIEKQEDKWVVLNTDISWSKEELLDELNNHPEHFSPNVILRGVLQERLLPDVTFIGGGAEVAYWFQLKPVFEHYNVFYPTILLRQSVLWIERQYKELQEQLNITDEQLFIKVDELQKQFVNKHSDSELSLSEELSAIEQQIKCMQTKAEAIDQTLSSSAEAVSTKIKYQLSVLEKKMLRAEKRNMDVQLNKIAKLRQALFPNESLQERQENFISYYPMYGDMFIKTLYNSIKPLKNEFLIVAER